MTNLTEAGIIPTREGVPDVSCDRVPQYQCAASVLVPITSSMVVFSKLQKRDLEGIDMRNSVDNAFQSSCFL